MAIQLTIHDQKNVQWIFFITFMVNYIITVITLETKSPKPFHIMHISHGFEGDIPEYQPRGDTKAQARYVT